MNDQSPTLGSLALALSKAQAQMKPAVKDKNNPFFKSKYADLSSVWDSIREPLSKNELSVIQTTNIDAERGAVLVTVLAHSSGEWIRSQYPINPVKNDPQGFGSAVTYARRYSLAALVGVCTDEDDDGAAASNNGNGGQREAYKNEINERLSAIDAKKTQKQAANVGPVDWGSFRYRYALPDNKPGVNSKQFFVALETNGARKNPSNGIWYSNKAFPQLEEYMLIDSRQDDIPFTGEV